MDAVVAPVGDVDVAGGVEVDAPRHIELAGVAAEAAELGDKASVFGVFLDAVVAGVHQEHIVVGVEVDAGGLVEFAGAGANYAPTAEPVAIFGKDGDPVQPLVSDVEVFVLIEGDGGGPDEGTVGGVFAGVHQVAAEAAAVADFADVFLGDGADGDALGVSPVVVSPADDVHHIVGAPGQGDRVLETGAGFLAPANGMGVTESYPLNLSSHSHLNPGCAAGE